MFLLSITWFKQIPIQKDIMNISKAIPQGVVEVYWIRYFCLRQHNFNFPKKASTSNDYKNSNAVKIQIGYTNTVFTNKLIK